MCHIIGLNKLNPVSSANFKEIVYILLLFLLCYAQKVKKKFLTGCLRTKIVDKVVRI